jgi:4-amino-4-deoxy-L-arabinose transferase-like glycosyltransferase
MNRLGIRWSASQVARAILIFWLLFMLGANLPGHLSYDSLAQLSEGRSGVRETWGPATYAWILGVFDEIVPGTGLYVAASAAVLFFSLSTLRRLRPMVSWWAAPVTLLIVLTPQFLIYQAIVWKDVLFANLAVAGFVCLARAHISWAKPGPRILALAGAVVCLAVASLVRQNGFVVVPVAAAVLGVLRWRDGWRQAIIWGFGGFLVVLTTTQILGASTQLKGEGLRGGPGFGIRILQHYDIIGAAARDPSYPLSHIGKVSPAAVAKIRSAAATPGVYSAERVDYLQRDPTVGQALWAVPNDVISTEWRELVFKHPTTYLIERAAVFRWLLASPRLQACLPLHVGVDGPTVLVDKLRLTNALDPADVSLANYATYFYDTPAYSHLAYAIVALLAAGFLLWRRDGADLVIAGLLLGALAFAGSFFVISIACDYRYIYFLDLAAMVGIFYLSLDPSPRLRTALFETRSDPT